MGNPIVKAQPNTILHILPVEIMLICAKLLDSQSLLSFKLSCRLANLRVSKEYHDRALKHAMNKPKGRDNRLTNLEVTLRDGKWDMFKFHLDAGLDPNGFIGDMSPRRLLLTVANRGSEKMVKLLLERGANINISPATFHAVDQVLDRLDSANRMASFLIRNGATFATLRGFQHILNAKNCVELFELVLKNGIDINRVYLANVWTTSTFQLDIKEFTVLHHAAAHGSPELLDVILSRGPNLRQYIDLATKIAIDFNMSDNASYLLRNGCEPTFDLLECAVSPHIYPPKVVNWRRWKQVVDMPYVMQMMATKLDLQAPDAAPYIDRYLDLVQWSGRFWTLSFRRRVLLALLRSIRPPLRSLYVESINTQDF
ncbi:hypothetical protein BO78DRAFT_418194 [Aspergillus sclerotiicarbonarius CBS 121057]|uniref:Uncharacterized protein n=1 Tax=Aspergillus sclerotiicarbonarius (strain CBS 121057 / IBT 28362) TaxID=1448318 RepID=A0A319ET25_ASPSB|nr:hypothetical protein BO78DRAFT_418194 [Aspergillus sclerotiicarbonarius CBS 121057]